MIRTGVDRVRALLALALIGLVSLGAGAAEMRLSLILDEGSDWYEGCRRFKELVEERASEEITVRIVTHAELSGGSQATELEMLVTGGLEAAIESSILLTNLDPAMRAFTQPWRFADHDAAEAFADGPEGQALLAGLEPHGVIGLAWGTNGFRQLTNSLRPVRAPADLAGMRVRVADSQQFIEFFRALGADPVTMNFGELIPNLQTGAVDAQENPLSVIWTARLFEVQKHLTLWNATYDPIALCVNAAWFRRQTPEVQAILRESAREAMAHERRFSRQREGEMLDQLRGVMEVAELGSAEIAAFRAALAPAPVAPAAPPATVRIFPASWLFVVIALILALGFGLVVLNMALAIRRRG